MLKRLRFPSIMLNSLRTPNKGLFGNLADSRDFDSQSYYYCYFQIYQQLNLAENTADVLAEALAENLAKMLADKSIDTLANKSVQKSVVNWWKFVVEILEQPEFQDCVISQNSGILTGHVTSIAITCVFSHLSL